MKSVEALLAEVRALKSPDREWYSFDALGDDRWNGAMSQYEDLRPLINDLAVALERCALVASDAIALTREAIALNDRFDEMITTLRKLLTESLERRS